MQFGVWGGLELAAAAARAGFAFMEYAAGTLLKPREDRAAFEAALRQARATGLPCPAVNCFVPGDLPITGPAARLPALRAYAAATFARAAEAGVELVVFGSGGARRIPEGFPRAAAWEQLVAFGALLGPLAEEHGLTVVIEPLNRAETNVLNTTAEAARLVREVHHPRVRLLVDAYHWAREQEPADAIVAHGALLAHVHVATYANRLMPGAEACDFGPFFGALRQARYGGRVAIEAPKVERPDEELPRALAVLRAAAA